MATVYSYIRFSSKPQEKGDSVRRQKTMGEAWMTRHPEHILDTSLSLRDLGISAFNGANLDKDKGDLGRFIHLAKQGQIPKGSILMLENLDRFSRQATRKAYRVFCELVEAGVTVLTLDPEQLIDEDNVDNMEVVLPVIIKMQLAYEESRKKSERLKQAWAGKRKSIGQRKMTAVAPQWLRLAKARDHFELIPERAEVVRNIFRWTKAGMGAIAIARRLNQELVPCFRKRGKHGSFPKWYDSYVKKILVNRAVLGEYQPRRMHEGKRVPVGEPIPDYFPAVVDEQDFYAAQRARGERRSQPGRHGRRMTNLFTDLLKDARDGSAMNVVNKGDALHVVSSAARLGQKGAVYLSFPYEHFERSLLAWGFDLQLGDVVPRKETRTEEDLSKAEGRLADLDQRVETVRSKIATAGNLDVLLDTLVDLETRRKEAQQKVQRLKQEQSTQEGEALNKSRELIEKLRQAPEQEVYGLRSALRATLRRLIEDIVVLVIQVNQHRVAIADVRLRNGKRRRVTVMPGKLVNLPEDLGALDVRKWSEWPEELRQSRYTAVTDEVRRMMAMDDRGISRTAIAHELGVSPSLVSRTLRSYGRRKQEKKPADSAKLMNWHAAGRGWVKRHKGQRYFVGIGTLKAKYPRLVKEKTEEGSWRAANRWWKEQLAEKGTARSAGST